MKTLTFKFLTLTAAAALLSGCADYLARHDGVSFGAGNAAARNAAIHMIDPWPRHSGNTNIEADGQRMAVTMRKYQTNDPDDGASTPKPGPGITGAGGKSSTSN